MLIVDDHPIVREGIGRRIERQSDMEVCGEADSRAAALDLIATTRPDLAIVDLTLKDSSGLELIKDIKVRSPHLPVLVLSMQDEAVYAERALNAGARGYVMKHEATENIIVAARQVLAGKVYLSQELSSKFLDVLFGSKGAAGSSPAERLTDRELEIFELLGRGNGTRQIAERLHLSIKTIEAHREQIKHRLNLTSANELLHHAFLWVQDQMASGH